MSPTDRNRPDAEATRATTRRHLLEIVSASGVAGLAGCSAIRDLWESDTGSSPTRVERTRSNTDSARRYREAVSSVSGNAESPFGGISFDYDPIRIDPADTANRPMPFGSIRAAPSDTVSGDRMWISSGGMGIQNIVTLVKASLGLQENIEVQAEVLDSRVTFIGSKSKNGVVGLIGRHRNREAVLVVRASRLSTAQSLAQNYGESQVVPE